jgi:hypothetical protein
MPGGSSYQPLADYLGGKKADSWTATFREIEEKLGRPLPQSAYRHQAWWANQKGNGHSQTHGWRSVGWRTAELDLASRRVRFERETDVATEPAARNPEAGEAELFERASRLSGISDRERLVSEALKALIEREAMSHLVAVGGTMPDYAAAPRERPEL